MIYIYGLVCPISGVVRYVGKCKNLVTRYSKHLAKALSHKPTHHHSTRWIRSLLSQGKQPIMRRLITLPENADWQWYEKVTIARYRRAGFDLTNLTGGGDGFHKISKESAALRGDAKRRWLATPGNLEKHLAALALGKTRPGYKRRASDGCRSAWQNPEKRENFLSGMRAPDAVARRSLATKRRYEDPAELERHASRMRELHSTPEARLAASKRSLAAHSDPVVKARHSAAIKSAFADPETKARLRAAIKKTMSNPDVRAKIGKGMRDHLADPENRQKRLEVFRSEGVRAKMSASAKARWSDPAAIAAVKAARSTPEYRAKMSEAAKKRATPEYRAMMAEKRRQAWQRQKSQQQD